MHFFNATNRRGFSMVEMLCVMAIIAILATLLCTVAAKAYKKAKDFSGQFSP